MKTLAVYWLVGLVGIGAVHAEQPHGVWYGREIQMCPMSPARVLLPNGTYPCVLTDPPREGYPHDTALASLVRDYLK